MRLCALCLSAPLREITHTEKILSILLILSKNKTRRESIHDNDA